MLEQVRSGRPKLPLELAPGVPEPLQAIALKAMERDKAHRYASARELALDLGRWLDGRPVKARPHQYKATLAGRVREHVEQVSDWERLRLVDTHEAEVVKRAYRQLEVGDDEWLLSARALSYQQIALYLGALFVVAGAAFYFVAHRVHGAVEGVVAPTFVLGIPLAALSAGGWWLERLGRRTSALAFFIAGTCLLPLLGLLWLHEAGLFAAPEAAEDQLVGRWASNRQFQLTLLVTAGWALALSVHTRARAMSSVTALFSFLLGLALLGEVGLRQWLEEGRMDVVARWLGGLAVVFALTSWAVERRLPSFSEPWYVAAAIIFVGALELHALQGKTFELVGLTTAPRGAESPEDFVLLDTLLALALTGVVAYAVATAAERWGTNAMASASAVLVALAPFLTLEPLAWLSHRALWSPRFDWLYLALALAAAVLSHRTQRRTFYYAGLINSGGALYLIAVRNGWIDRVGWAAALLAVGLAALGLGYALDHRRTGSPERAR